MVLMDSHVHVVRKRGRIIVIKSSLIHVSFLTLLVGRRQQFCPLNCVCGMLACFVNLVCLSVYMHAHQMDFICGCYYM